MPNKTTKKKLVKYSSIKNKVRTLQPMNQFNLGTDPELFITRRKRVIGSEKLLKGRKLRFMKPNGFKAGYLVEDGVQIELNPNPENCREALANRIRNGINKLAVLCEEGKCKLSKDVTVEITKHQYNSLSDKNKRFGCDMSYNVHTKEASEISIDPAKYLKRSSGGHIHLGTDYADMRQVTAIKNPDRLVDVLDVILGNTMVMIDRDEGNVERRKHYGRAGEFRTPSHGLEYRTLSNFWLIAPPVMSLVFGLARQAVNIVATNQDKLLLSLVDMEDIIKAINNNDYELAKKNWNKYKEFLIRVNSSFSYYPIRSKKEIENFEYVAEKGLSKWFSDDIIKNWTSSIGNPGWGNFQTRVSADKTAEKKAKARKKK